MGITIVSKSGLKTKYIIKNNLIDKFAAMEKGEKIRQKEAAKKFSEVRRKKALRDEKRQAVQEKEEAKKASFLNKLEKKGPNKILKMYLAKYHKIRHGKKMRDKATFNTTYYEEACENIIDVQVYNYQDDQYIKINGVWLKTNEYYNTPEFMHNCRVKLDYNDMLTIEKYSLIDSDTYHYKLATIY